MPIKDGVPQWDALSYQYVTQRIRPRSAVSRPRPQSEMLTRSSPRPLLNVVESSFIGTGNNANYDDTNNQGNDAGRC